MLRQTAFHNTFIPLDGDILWSVSQGVEVTRSLDSVFQLPQHVVDAGSGLKHLADRHKCETRCDRTGLSRLGGQGAMRGWGSYLADRHNCETPCNRTGLS